MRVVNPLRCYMDITARQPKVMSRDGPLVFDAIIPRIGASITFYGTAVVRQFEVMGVYTVAESQAIARSRDKLRSLQLLSREGLGMPVTGFARSGQDVSEIIELVGGAPLIIKLLEGTQGRGVVLAETRKAAESVIDAFQQLDANILVARILGLDVAGVDMLRSSRGPLLMEVNSSPGLEGIETASGVDVAGAIVQYIEGHADHEHDEPGGREDPDDLPRGPRPQEEEATEVASRIGFGQRDSDESE